jgi:hypothetical protein
MSPPRKQEGGCKEIHVQLAEDNFELMMSEFLRKGEPSDE